MSRVRERNWPAALVVLVASAALALALPGASKAEINLICNEGEAGEGSGGSSVSTSAGEREENRISIGMRNDRTVGIKSQGADAQGEPLDGEFACAFSSRVAALTVHLGDRNDIVRLDASGVGRIGGRGGYKPVLPRVSVNLAGGKGADRILGHGGDGALKGGSGDDVLRDTGGADVLIGGSGDDRLDARDGEVDLIRCGPGEDIVIADRKDRLSGC